MHEADGKDERINVQAGGWRDREEVWTEKLDLYLNKRIMMVPAGGKNVEYFLAKLKNESLYGTCVCG